ncbi:MAG: glycosyltransferase, partial [Acidimicrobiia bacterium]
MNSSERPQIVVLGMMTVMPYGGVVWQTLHYLAGFERLGFETYYVEAHARTPGHFMLHIGDDGSKGAAAFIQRILRPFGFGDRWAFHAVHSDGRSYGMSETDLRQLYQSAQVLVNLHGGTLPQPEHVDTGRVVCVDTDPVRLEMELHQGLPEAVRFCEAHRAIFSFGENYGRPDCLLPVSERFRIRPTRQPVVMDFWGSDGEEREAFTTIANWFQPWRPIKYKGETYRWSKHLEFLKLLDLPKRTKQPLELALSRCGDEHRKLLEDNGWRVRDALAVSGDIETTGDLEPYRRYITTSRAEFTVAKDQNVRLRSGWFSDRSATYLAAGRPVVTQDTGFGHVLPTGDGLFAFSMKDEALAAIEAINADYDRHRKAAREIAREYFAHDVVLAGLLDDLRIERPRGGASKPRRAVLPSDLV